MLMNMPCDIAPDTMDDTIYAITTEAPMLTSDRF